MRLFEVFASLRVRPAIISSFIVLVTGASTSQHEMRLADSDVPGIRVELALTIGADAPESALVCAPFGFVQVARDAAGRFFVPGCDCGTVHEYSADGAYARTLGQCGQGPGEVEAVTAVAARESLYVVGPGRVVEYTSDGTFSGQFAIRGGPDFLAVSPFNELLINYLVFEDDLMYRIQVHAPSGELLRSLARYRLEARGLEVSINKDPAIAVSPDGTVWVVQRNHRYRIEGWSRDGALTHVIERDAGWYREYDDMPGRHRALIIPRGATWADGLLFVLGQRPLEWVDSAPPPDDRSFRNEQVVEAVDPVNGILVAQQTLDRGYLGFVDRFLYRLRDAGNDTTVVDLYRLTISSGPSGSG